MPKQTPVGNCVYGASDDLIEIEGEISVEVSYWHERDDGPALVFMPDGTILSVIYGKPGFDGVWGVSLVKQGTHFDRIDVCTDEDADIYSDVAYFKEGLKKLGKAYVATKWEASRSR